MYVDLLWIFLSSPSSSGDVERGRGGPSSWHLECGRTDFHHVSIHFRVWLKAIPTSKCPRNRNAMLYSTLCKVWFVMWECLSVCECSEDASPCWKVFSILWYSDFSCFVSWHQLCCSFLNRGESVRLYFPSKLILFQFCLSKLISMN